MERDITLVRSFTSGYVISFLGILALLGGVGVYEYLKKKSFIILFGVGWFFVMIASVSGVVPINGILYEHWLYTPLIGVLLVIAGLIQLLPLKKVPTYFINWGLGSLVGIGVILTIYQNYIWADPIRFYEYTLQYANSPRLHNNLAMSYADEKQFAKAIPEYQKAIALSDSYPQTHHNLANSYGALEKYDLAEKEYLVALKMDPNFYYTYPQLINLYMQTKQSGKAIPYLEKLLVQDPNNIQFLLIYGKALQGSGKVHEAQHQFEQALQLSHYNPQVQALISSFK